MKKILLICVCLSVLALQLLFAQSNNRPSPGASAMGASAMGAIVFSIIASIVVWIKNQFNNNRKK